MPPTILNIDDMEERQVGVSPGIAEGYREAARVCVDRHHTSPHEFRVIDSNVEQVVTLTWQQTDWRLRNSWGNKDDATEVGVYCLDVVAGRWI